MAVTLGVYGDNSATGYTSFTASGDSRIVYVSQSGGNDANDGLSTGAPLKTLAAGLALLRSGFPDWLLLKKGDTWTDEKFGYPGLTGGRSATEPMVFGAYGTGAKPLVQVKDTVDTFPAFGWLHAADGNFTALVGIEFYAYKRDPANPSYDATAANNELSGFSNLAAQTWMLIEDCKWRFFGVGIGSPWSNDALGAHGGTLIFRRNVIQKAYQLSSIGHAEGLFISGWDSITLEENVFDHNGWCAGITGAEANQFNHNVYIHGVNGTDVTVQGNITARAASHGLQARTGRTITNNLVVANAIGILVGCTADVSRNVVLEAGDIGGIALGWGIDAEKIIDGITVDASINLHDNILAHETSTGGNGYPILIGQQGATSGVTAQSNLLYDWESLATAGVYIAELNGSSGNTISGNTTNGVGYPAPTRSVGSYDSSVMGGPGTLDHFMTLATAQSKDTWDPRLTANAVNTYIRAGFGIPTSVIPLRFRLHA
jgi:hypothetical protein